MSPQENPWAEGRALAERLMEGLGRAMNDGMAQEFVKQGVARFARVALPSAGESGGGPGGGRNIS